VVLRATDGEIVDRAYEVLRIATITTPKVLLKCVYTV